MNDKNYNNSQLQGWDKLYPPSDPELIRQQKPFEATVIHVEADILVHAITDNTGTADEWKMHRDEQLISEAELWTLI